MQFAVIIIAFFVLSLNAVSAPVTVESSILNPLINYQPDALSESARAVNAYVPILSSLDPDQVHDQILSTTVGTEETPYVDKPMLVETIDHDMASRIRRGLRKEIVTHTVQQGETLGKIATTYGINVATILEDNKINVNDINKIKPGTELTIAPERKTESLAWLDQLHEEERKAREQREKEELARQTKLAQANRSRVTVASARAADDEGDSSSGGGGNFRKPIGVGCYNGYHWYAIDCPTSIGSAVRASAGGVVVTADSSGYNGGYGDTILIRHPGGWETRYAHLSSVNVVPGQSVSAGQVIAASGNTGRSTGPHLHFEIIDPRGNRQNPKNYVGL